MALHRQVFFIGGFDPKSPRLYHRLYREAVGQRPASCRGERVTVGARERESAHLDAWTVDWHDGDGRTLSTRYTVLRWDDVVRRHWPRHLRRTVADYLHVYGYAGVQGIFAKVKRHAPAAFWLAMLPLGVCLLCLLACGLLVGALATTWGWGGGWATAATLGAWLLLWRGIESRLDSEWLLRLYGFTWYQATDQLPDLEARLDTLADELLQRIRGSSAREVLLVGHSTGSIMAASVLARACAKDARLGVDGPQLALLTLGHCVPVLGWLRQAERFRAELAQLSDHPGLTWHDVSAPTDWAAFASVAPWPHQGRARLRRTPPRFHKTMGAGAYDALLADRHALHMQYLRAPRHTGGYDPVEWTAGPMTLAERHATAPGESIEP